MKKVIFVLAVIAVAACSRLQVTSDWDPGVDFTPLRAYVLLPNETPGLNPFARQRIEAAIHGDLQSKGMRHVVDEAEADMAVGFDVATENRTSYQTVHTGFAHKFFNFFGFGVVGNL